MSEIVKGRLEHVPVKLIRENPAAIREVDTTTTKWAEFLSNIRALGVLKAVLLHECKDKETGELYYGLSDGLHRVTAARAAGLETVPANILPMEEAQVLQTQLMLNLHTIATKPVEYSRAIIRMLGLNPTMTMSELCANLNVSPQWLNQRLSLLKLKEEYQKLVEEGKLNLTNAYALAKLEVSEQPNFIDRALTESPDVFVQVANERVKAMRDAKRKGHDAGSEQFVATAHAKKVAELKQELETGAMAKFFKSKSMIASEEDFKLAVQWVLHLDPVATAAAKAQWDAKQKEKQDKERKKLLEKARVQQDEAAEILKNLQATQSV